MEVFFDLLYLSNSTLRNELIMYDNLVEKMLIFQKEIIQIAILRKNVIIATSRSVMAFPELDSDVYFCWTTIRVAISKWEGKYK